MEILWLAIVLYSAGLALVLHFRPALMFNDDGTWKEFGYQRSSRHTLLPFWLFVVAWAFVSYAIATAISWMWISSSSSEVAAASASASMAASYWSPESESDSDSDLDMSTTSQYAQPQEPVLPSRRGPGRPRKEKANIAPGYYVRENDQNENGIHRYIYYGPDAPAAGAGQDAAVRLPNATP